MNMAYPAIFDDLMDVSSSTKNEKMVQKTFLKFSLDQHSMGDDKKPLEVQQIYYVVFLLINSKEDYEKYKKLIEFYQQGMGTEQEGTTH